MIKLIDAEIQFVRKSFVDFKPYLCYTIMCTDVTDTKQKLSTKFRLDYKDEVRFVIDVNDIIDIHVVDLLDSYEKKHLLRWLISVDEDKGFYLSKTYVFSNVLFKSVIEEKFVRVRNDYFANIINVLSLM